MEKSVSSSELVFAIGKSKNWKHYRIHQGGKDGPVVYNGLVHNFKRGKPTIELREGSSDADPVVGFSSVDYSGFSSQIALGDPLQKDTNAIEYEILRAKRAFAFKEYNFETDELNEERQRRQYTWVRTKTSPGRFECRDLQSGDVLAEFRSNGFWKWTKIGTVTISAPNPSQRAIEFLLLVFLSWSEMENREAGTIAAIAH
jgi:hypothetical protein